MTQRVERLLTARMLVASLGEMAEPSWWRSQATTQVHGRWLERLFPRTALSAALEIASRAAQIEHDTHIGRMGVYHLFRLPGPSEADLMQTLRSGAVDLQSTAKLKSFEERISALSELAGVEQEPATPGPVSCGDVDTLLRGRALQRVCAAYVSGFKNGTHVYPYLEARVP